MVIFVLYISVIWLSYLYDYLANNERRESSETASPFFNTNFESSFELELKIYVSKVKESDSSLLIMWNDQNDPNPTDLCKTYKHKIEESLFFKKAGSAEAN